MLNAVVRQNLSWDKRVARADGAQKLPGAEERVHAGEANRRRTETPSRRVRHSARRRARRLEESNVSEFVITLVGYLFIKILRFAIYWLIVFSAFLLIAAHHRYSVRTRRVLLRRTTLLDHRHDKVPSDLANPSGFGLHACSSMIATEPNVGRTLRGVL